MEANERTSRTDKRRAAAWKLAWMAAKYTGLTAASVLMYKAAAAYALRERGYEAVGGEALLLLLPAFYYIIERMVLDVIEGIKAELVRARLRG